MKKKIVLSLKAVIGVLPVGVKRRLRNQHRLREWYAGTLHHSGIFYDLPPRKRSLKLYRALLKHIVRKLGTAEADSEEQGSLAIVVSSDRKNTKLSLEHAAKQLGLITHLSKDVYVLTESNSSFFEQRGLKTISADELLTITTPTLFIRIGDTLNETIFEWLRNQPITSDVRYFDTDFQTGEDKYEFAHCLPDWNPDLQLTTGYVETGFVVRNPQQFFLEIGADQVRESYVTWLIASYLSGFPHTVHHTSYPLVHRRSIEAESLDVPVATGGTPGSADQCMVGGQKEFNFVGRDDSACLVSLIVPTYNAKYLVEACVNSILEKTDYQNYEILLVDNNSDDPESLAYFAELNKHPKIRLLRYPHPFNYSAINNFAVQQAKGDVIGLVNNDIEVITPKWLNYMVGHALRKDIGCVGAKLLYSDGKIQHAGVVLGYGGGAGHAHKYFPRYHAGYMNRLVATQNYSAVTAACLLVKKSIYEEVGGLDEVNLEVAFNDVDFCLRVLETGVRNLYCAEAELYHHESVSRGLDITAEKAARFNRELSYLQKKWKKYIDHDPAYNPNLTLNRENFSLKEPREYK